jgi:uncharacterized Ntn-hydrolase superfamily protein
MTFSLGNYLHTYTIVGRCPRTFQFGVALATYSLGVGGYCPYVRTNIGALASQAYANPQLGILGMRLLELGFSAGKVLDELRKEDDFYEYRQIGIVSRDGTGKCHTGSATRAWAGHIVGDGYVAMGNALAGEHIVRAIAEAFDASAAERLDERLVRGIEAARDAGGQTSKTGDHLAERSAALVLHHFHDYPMMDIRVDAHDQAVDELRRIHGIFVPYSEYRERWINDPSNVPSQDEWARKHGIRW